MRAHHLGLAMAACVLARGGAASAAEADPNAALLPPKVTPKQAPRPDLGEGDKRAPPVYDGRPEATTTGEDLLWIPRVILSPIYVVTEFVLRRPLSAIVPAAEAGASGGSPLDLFRFGPHNDLGLTPKFYVESGFRPRAGLYFFHDNFIAPKNDLRATFTAGGENWFKASALDRIPITVRGDFVATELELRLAGVLRPDLLFWGTGPRSRAEDKGNYELRSAGGTVRLRHNLSTVSSFEAWFTARRDAFTRGECGPELRSVPTIDDVGVRCEHPSIEQRVREGRYPVPNGYAEPGAVTTTGLLAKFDTRDPWPGPGSGVAADLRGEFGTRTHEGYPEWIGYAGAVAGFIDITGSRRVLSLTIDVRGVDALDPADGVPFTELAGAKRVDDVPDIDLMRGFSHGRLAGESATVATLEYVWPIWSFIDATVQAAVGNVWGRRFEGLDPQAMRFSFSAGLRTPNRRDHTFNLLFGFGTAPFDEGAVLEGPRIIFGSTTGF